MIIEGISIIGVTIEREATATQVVGVDNPPGITIVKPKGKVLIQLRLPGECGEALVEMHYEAYLKTVEPLVRCSLSGTSGVVPKYGP